MSITVKAAVPALVAVFKAAAVTGLQVSDGPIDDPKVNYFAVGWSGGESGAISGNLTLADFGQSQNMESYDVQCLLSHWCGNKDVPTVRAALLDDFDALRAALRANPTLGIRKVVTADISRFELDDDIYETGEVAAMKITVTVTAWS